MWINVEFRRIREYVTPFDYILGMEFCCHNYPCPQFEDAVMIVKIINLKILFEETFLKEFHEIEIMSSLHPGGQEEQPFRFLFHQFSSYSFYARRSQKHKKYN